MSLGGGGSGGGGGGGAVVQTYDPAAITAANEATQGAVARATRDYQFGINSAISGLRDQYGIAQQQIAPYAQTGVQALNQLNYYLGLDPVSATAPTAPKKVTMEEKLAGITAKDQDWYVKHNTWNNQYLGAGKEFVGNNPNAVLSNWNAANAVHIANAQAQANDANRDYESQLAAYNTQKQNYDYVTALGDKYRALGPLTSEGLQAAVAAQPGYAAELSQGVDAIQRSAASKGMLNSGRMLSSLMSYGQNTMSKYYGGMLSNLAQLAGAGQQAATTSGGYAQNYGQNTGQINMAGGDALANAQLAAGNAQSQALMEGGKRYSVMGGSSGGGGGGMAGLGSVLGGLGSIAAGGGFSGLFG